MVLPILWFTNTAQGYQTERALNTLYIAAGRDDLAGMAPVLAPLGTSPWLDRQWIQDRQRSAAASRAPHGPPVGINVTAASFIGDIHLGTFGFVNYLVRYQDGAVEHNLTAAHVGAAWQRAGITLPPPTIEQELRSCYQGSGIAILSVGEIQPDTVGVAACLHRC